MGSHDLSSDMTWDWRRSGFSLFREEPLFCRFESFSWNILWSVKLFDRKTLIYPEITESYRCTGYRFLWCPLRSAARRNLDQLQQSEIHIFDKVPTGQCLNFLSRFRWFRIPSLARFRWHVVREIFRCRFLDTSRLLQYLRFRLCAVLWVEEHAHRSVDSLFQLRNKTTSFQIFFDHFLRRVRCQQKLHGRILMSWQLTDVYLHRCTLLTVSFDALDFFYCFYKPSYT